MSLFQSYNCCHHSVASLLGLSKWSIEGVFANSVLPLTVMAAGLCVCVCVSVCVCVCVCV